jgi:hypothetical protein
VSAALSLARSYGVAIAFADLGEWAGSKLRSEYDPTGPAIRINVRLAEKIPTEKLGEYLALAIGHELYHHREKLGEVARIADRASRERAADEYAQSLLTT